MNWKVHGAVIGVITLVILVMYFITKPGPPPGAQFDVTDRYIRIDQAHWGLNCNANYYAYQRRKQQQALGSNKDAPEPKLVERNNVLSHISKLCDIKPNCTFSATSVELGDAYPDCLKELQLSWRCFSYDRLRSLTLSEGETANIDCTKDDTNKSAAPASK